MEPVSRFNVSDHNQIKKMKKQVDNFSSEHTRVPEWVLLLEWMQNDKPPEPLQYEMNLKGTGEDSDLFRIVHNPGYYSTWPKLNMPQVLPL